MTSRTASKATDTDAPRRRARRMSSPERQHQIIQCAIAEAARLGLGRASHSDVARLAGVAVPTVFHYFASRADLAAAIVAEVARFLLDDLLAGADQTTLSAPASIESVLMAFCDSIESHPDYARVWLEWSVAVRGETWQRYLEFHRHALEGIRRIAARGVVERTIRDDLDLDDVARVIVSLAHMVAQMKFSGASRAQVKRTVHSLVHGYLERSNATP